MQIIYPLKALPALIAKLQKAEAAACGLDDKAYRLRMKIVFAMRNSSGDISLSFDYDEIREYL